MIIDDDAFLEHYGKKGMQWGVRSNRTPGVSRRTDREARRDAEEAARAKQFYGKGAGTRRKLSKATVEGKSKRDPAYAKAFERHLSRQDTSKHAEKARSERKRKDVKETSRKTAGALARQFTGEMGNVAAVVAAGAAAVAFFRSSRGRQTMNTVVSKLNTAVDNTRRRQGAAWISDYISRNS